MENEIIRGASGKIIEELMKPMNSFGSELRKIINSISDIEGNEEQAKFKLLIKALSIKASVSYRAIELLLKNGLIFDSMTLLRSLLELVISVAYIIKQPEKRSKLFIEYDPVARHRMYELAKKMGFDKLRFDREELEKEYESVRRNYKCKSRWSDKNLEQMAKDAKLENIYNYFYSRYSDYVHSDIRTIDNFLQIDIYKGVMNDNVKVAIKEYIDIIFETSTFAYVLAENLKRVFSNIELESLDNAFNNLKERSEQYEKNFS